MNDPIGADQESNPVPENWKGADWYQPQSEEDSVALFIANQRPEAPDELRAFKNGFSHLFDARARLLANTSYRIVRSQEEAASLTQEVGCRLYQRGLLMGDINAAGVRSLMYRMVYNLSLDYANRHEMTMVDRTVDHSERVVEFAASTDVAEAVVDEIAKSELTSRIALAMERLRPRPALILRMRLWDDLTLAEISADLGMSPNATKVAYYRALSSLREILADSGEGSANPVMNN